MRFNQSRRIRQLLGLEKMLIILNGHFLGLYVAAFPDSFWVELGQSNFRGGTAFGQFYPDFFVFRHFSLYR